MFGKIKKKLAGYKRKFRMYAYKKWLVKNKSIDAKSVVFESGLGRNYSANPRAIYEEMMSRGLDKEYKIYWLCITPDSLEIPGNCTKLERGSWKALKKMQHAAFWVMDGRQPGFMTKNPNTKYIMTWHGTPLKKLALDMDDVVMAGNKGIEHYKAVFWSNVRRWDYLLAQNQYSAEIFRNCFDFRKKMLKVGYPRNDVLVNNNNPEYINMLKDKYKLPKDKKIILYAPTWRDYEQYGRCRSLFMPHINFDVVYRNLKDEYIMIVKYHYFVADHLDWTRFRGFIRNIDTDIKELYLVSDYMVTDYSSTMYDYSILNRPMVFYPYDLDKYDSARGFYEDYFETVPGPVAYTTDEFIDIFKNHHDFSQYDEKYAAFKKKYNHLDDGKASARVVDEIVRVMNEEAAADKASDSTAQ